MTHVTRDHLRRLRSLSDGFPLTLDKMASRVFLCTADYFLSNLDHMCNNQFLMARPLLSSIERSLVIGEIDDHTSLIFSSPHRYYTHLKVLAAKFSHLASNYAAPNPDAISAFDTELKNIDGGVPNDFIHRIAERNSAIYFSRQRGDYFLQSSAQWCKQDSLFLSRLSPVDGKVMWYERMRTLCK